MQTSLFPSQQRLLKQQWLPKQHTDDDSDLARYRAIAEMSSDFYWECGPDFRFTLLCDRFEGLMKLSPEAFAAEHDLVDVVATTPRRIRERVEAIRAGRTFCGFEISLMDGDGRLRIFELCGRAIHAPDGRFLGHLGAAHETTKAKAAEKALSESEDRYRSLIELAPEAVLILSETSVLYANESAAQLYGCSRRDDLVGVAIEDLVPPGQSRLVEKNITSILNSREAISPRELEILRADGMIVDVEAKSGPIIWRGRPAVMSFVRDISRRKQAEQRLSHSEQQFRDLVEGSVQGIVIHANSRIIYANEAMAGIFGYSLDELIGLDIVKLTAPEHVALNRDRNVARLQGEAVPSRYKVKGVRRDGKQIWLDSSARLVEWEGGVAIQSVVVDITEQVNAVDELRKIRTQLQNAIENINEGFSLFDKDMNLVLCNTRFREMFCLVEDVIVPGTPLETILRTSAERGLYGDQIDDIDTWVAERLGQRSAPQGALELQFSDDRWIRVSEVRTAEGGVAGVYTDVTALRKVEEHLRASEKLNALGQLAGGVAHDFNNILMIVDGYAKRALEQAGDPECVQSSLSEVLAATDRAKSLTAQLLVFGRRKRIEKQAVRAAKLMWEVEGLVKPLLGESIQIEVNVADRDACVATDPGQMSQALVNLAINARDAMPLGGKLELSLDVEDAGSGELVGQPVLEGPVVRVSVRDHGTGMDKDTLSHIFEPFFTTKEPGKGTGLGLAMVYGFVQQSGGSIEVDSRLHAGTTFTIRLPLAGKVPAEDFSSAERRDLAARGETILYAEDNIALRRLVQEGLEGLGYRVLSAGDGFEALELESEHDGRIDLLLTDVVMPGLDGIELSRIVREMHPETKIILISGYPARGQEGGKPAESEYTMLRKPIDSADLARAIREALDTPQQGVAAAE